MDPCIDLLWILDPGHVLRLPNFANIERELNKNGGKSR